MTFFITENENDPTMIVTKSQKFLISFAPFSGLLLRSRWRSSRSPSNLVRKQCELLLDFKPLCVQIYRLFSWVYDFPIYSGPLLGFCSPSYKIGAGNICLLSGSRYIEYKNTLVIARYVQHIPESSREFQSLTLSYG